MAGGLGKGLDALFIENGFDANGKSHDKTIVKIRLSDIEPDRNQPRKNFDEKLLEELAESIRENGLITPVIVRKNDLGRYTLIAGERRWRAAKLAGLSEIDAYLREIDDRTADVYALVENLQRVDLNPIEEARGYETLIEKYGITQEQAAGAAGKSRSAVTNSLGLLNLPEKVIQMVEEEKLSGGQARTLLSFGDEESIMDMAEFAVKTGASVRELEKRSKAFKREKSGKKDSGRDINIQALEKELGEALGRKVVIASGARRGRIIISYYGNDDLNNLSDRLMKS